MSKTTRNIIIIVLAAVLVAAAVIVGVMLSRKSSDAAATGGTQTVSITLPANPTTGYTWTSQSTGEGILTLAGDVYSGSNTSLAGAGGTELYTYLPTGAGDVALEFVYKQEWDGGSEAYSVTYRFEIDDSLTAKFLSKEATPLDGSAPEDLPEFPDPVLEAA